MKFILAITTYNRLEYLKNCFRSWTQTKSKEQWSLIVADDGSTDGTIEFLESYENENLILIKNNRIGVHNQMNSILSKLSSMEFDLCFKIDDDIEFLKPGWDNLYYNAAKETGKWHLVFNESKWSSEQNLKNPVQQNGLIAHNSIMNVHGFFYTISKEMIDKVGYFDVNNFGFRGMGHVDYTARACRAGFNDINHPFDVIGSQEFISAFREDYSGAIQQSMIHAYDEYHRARKEEIILKNRLFIEKKSNGINYDVFLKELPKAYEFALQKKNKEIDWYKSTYEVLPKWWKKVGALLRRTK